MRLLRDFFLAVVAVALITTVAGWITSIAVAHVTLGGGR